MPRMTPMAMDVPQDLIEPADAAKEYQIPYTLIRSWWQRGRITRYKQGGWRVLISRTELEREIKRSQTIEPAPPDR